jgi:hypothetical protein
VTRRTSNVLAEELFSAIKHTINSVPGQAYESKRAGRNLYDCSLVLLTGRLRSL